MREARFERGSRENRSSVALHGLGRRIGNLHILRPTHQIATLLSPIGS
jgi:hypothetical protein